MFSTTLYNLQPLLSTLVYCEAQVLLGAILRALYSIPLQTKSLSNQFIEECADTVSPLNTSISKTKLGKKKIY